MQKHSEIVIFPQIHLRDGTPQRHSGTVRNFGLHYQRFCVAPKGRAQSLPIARPHAPAQSQISLGVSPATRLLCGAIP